MSANSFFLAIAVFQRLTKPSMSAERCDLVLCLQPAAKTDAALLDKNVLGNVLFLYVCFIWD